MFDGKLLKLAKFLKENHLAIATAESCTGGLLSSRLTDVSGSSDFVKLNFVTYAYEAKTEILGVPKELLEKQKTWAKQRYGYYKKLEEEKNCE